MKVKMTSYSTRHGRRVVKLLQLFMLSVAIVAVLAGGITIASRVSASDEPLPEGSRVVTLFDRGVERSFVTSATTVGAALEDAGIETDTRDRVEPGLDEEFVANEYTINVYRARPLLVIDGNLRQVVMTAAQVASQIVEDADLTLYDEDEARLEQSDDLLTDGAAERLVVTRATPFVFTLYGKTFTARTQAKTVGEMLQEKGITLSKNDRVSVEREAPITEGMKLRVWREGKQTVTKNEKVAFEVEQIQDANRPVGYRTVKTPGVDGVRTVTYEVTIRDGKEVKRKEIASVTKKAPKKQVEIVGTKSDMRYTGGGSKTDWLRQSGIPESEWGYVDFIVSRESGWNPNAQNPSSGACGLAQSYPCGKQSAYGHWTDPVANLKWQYEYVKGRYGGYKGAYEFWQRNHSY